MAQKKKPLFHKPKTTGEKRKIPTPLPVKILSVLSLVLLAALTVFAVYAAVKQRGELVALSPGYAMSAPLLLILLPVVCWIIALGFRLAVRLIPLEMWRLPLSIRDATIQTSGKYLKICTLLIELETVLSFGYLTVTLYNKRIPGDIPILIWVALIAATIIFFGRYVLIEAQRQ
ncbi:MAG: hypothetical protein IJ106_01150 [Parasporobacterium sp.]|nr:hypothetical protein [Parasporobacterium sp.]